MNRVYPPDLVHLVKKAWSKPREFERGKRPALPSDDALGELLSVVYHASLLKEEGRDLRFRLVVMSKSKRQNGHVHLSDKPRQAVFTSKRHMTIGELRRLAPAVDATSGLICIEHNKEAGWQVWGLLDIGDNWWRFVHHEVSGGTPPPEDFTIASSGPGELTISSGADVLLTLRSGVVYYPQDPILYEGEIHKRLELSRKKLHKDVLVKLGVKKYDEEGHDEEYPKRFYNMCLSRVLNTVRGLNHGGTVLVVPDDFTSDDPRLSDRAIIKHPCVYDYAWELMVEHLVTHRLYYDLYFADWQNQDAGKKFQEMDMLDHRREVNDQALADCFRFMATLTSIDGAVVMTDRFRVLGFGAEVVAQSPTLRDVHIAADPKAQFTKPTSIEAYGTRHRSAFRFCSTYELSIAFIVSSDGGVKAPKRVGSKVVLWPEIQSNDYGW